MIDAWMKMWTDVTEQMVANLTDTVKTVVPTLPMTPQMMTPDVVMPAAAPLLMPTIMGAAAANAAIATWAGFWMGAPLAGAAALGILTSGTSAPVARTSSTTPKLTKPVVKRASPKVALKTAVKTSAKKAVKTATIVKAASGKPVATKTDAKKVEAAKPVTKTARATKLNDRPMGLDAPKGGKADDLKRISGLGPKLESVLNDLGIYHFEQIAGWTPKQIAWVDDYLRFKGRIKRDRWIAQVKTFLKETA